MNTDHKCSIDYQRVCINAEQVQMLKDKDKRNGYSYPENKLIVFFKLTTQRAVLMVIVQV